MIAVSSEYSFQTLKYGCVLQKWDGMELLQQTLVFLLWIHSISEVMNISRQYCITLTVTIGHIF